MNGSLAPQSQRLVAQIEEIIESGLVVSSMNVFIRVDDRDHDRRIVGENVRTVQLRCVTKPLCAPKHRTRDVHRPAPTDRCLVKWLAIESVRFVEVNTNHS